MMNWFRTFAEGELAAAICRHPHILFGGSVPDGIKTFNDVLCWYSHRHHISGTDALRDISHIYKVPLPSAT